jgi:hypothetical protein
MTWYWLIFHFKSGGLAPAQRETKKASDHTLFCFAVRDVDPKKERGDPKAAPVCR